MTMTNTAEQLFDFKMAGAKGELLWGIERMEEIWVNLETTCCMVSRSVLAIILKLVAIPVGRRES